MQHSQENPRLHPSTKGGSGQESEAEGSHRKREAALPSSSPASRQETSFRQAPSLYHGRYSGPATGLRSDRNKKAEGTFSGSPARHTLRYDQKKTAQKNESLASPGRSQTAQPGQPHTVRRSLKKKVRFRPKGRNILALVLLVLIIVLGVDNLMLRHSNNTLSTRLEAALHPPDLEVAQQDQQYGYQGKPLSDLYPDMVVDWRMEPAYIPQEPMVYLTFDDGPSKITPQILDTLDAYGVKATFFVTGKKDETLSSYYKEIVDRGHTLAMHTWSHQYQTIYASLDNFLADYYELYTWIYEKTGVKPTMFRFPGGTTNAYANKKFQTFDAIKNEMNSRGFTYFDWNVSSGDASGQNVPAEQIIENVVKGASGKKYAVVLMHDSSTKATTAAALPRMIEELAAAGFHFDRLTEDLVPIQFK